MYDYTGLDNNDAEVSHTSNEINWKKKKGRMRKNKISSETEEVVVLLLMSSNLYVDEMKRTHFESEKRSRGRNRPSFI